MPLFLCGAKEEPPNEAHESGEVIAGEKGTYRALLGHRGTYHPSKTLLWVFLSGTSQMPAVTQAPLVPETRDRDGFDTTPEPEGPGSE